MRAPDRSRELDQVRGPLRPVPVPESPLGAARRGDDRVPRRFDRVPDDRSRARFRELRGLDPGEVRRRRGEALHGAVQPEGLVHPARSDGLLLDRRAGRRRGLEEGDRDGRLPQGHRLGSQRDLRLSRHAGHPRALARGAASHRGSRALPQARAPDRRGKARDRVHRRLEEAIRAASLDDPAARSRVAARARTRLRASRDRHAPAQPAGPRRNRAEAPVPLSHELDPLTDSPTPGLTDDLPVQLLARHRAGGRHVAVLRAPDRDDLLPFPEAPGRRLRESGPRWARRRRDPRVEGPRARGLDFPGPCGPRLSDPLARAERRAGGDSTVPRVEGNLFARPLRRLEVRDREPGPLPDAGSGAGGSLAGRRRGESLPVVTEAGDPETSDIAVKESSAAAEQAARPAVPGQRSSDAAAVAKIRDIAGRERRGDPVSLSLLIIGTGLAAAAAHWMEVRGRDSVDVPMAPAFLGLGACLLLAFVAGRRLPAAAPPPPESRPAERIPGVRAVVAAALGVVSAGLFALTWRLQSRPPYHAEILAAWLGSLAAAGGAFALISSRASAMRRPPWVAVTVLALILLAGVWCRLGRLDLVPEGFAGDEASQSMDGMELLT